MSGKTMIPDEKRKHWQRAIFVIISFSLFALWFICLDRNRSGVQSQVFFHDSNDWFMDFYHNIYYSTDRTPYTWSSAGLRNYLPLAYLILYPLTHLYPYTREPGFDPYIARYSQRLAIAGAAFFLFAFGVLFYCLYKKCRGTEVEKIGILTALFCSGVTIFSIDRENLIILAAGLTFVFLLTYRSPKTYIRHIGFICLAVAAALKLSPAMFGLLLVFNKQYKDAVYTILYGIAFAVVPFFFIQGGVLNNLKLFFGELKRFTATYSHLRELGLIAPTIFGTGEWNGKFLSWLLCLLALALCSAAKNEFKQLMLLSLAFLLTTGVQFRYALLFLFFSTVALLSAQKCEKDDALFLAAFLIIYSPYQYDFTVGGLVFTPIRVINTLCLLLYFYLIIGSTIPVVRNFYKKKLKKAA